MACTYENCDLNHLPFDALIKALITKDAEGCLAIRTMQVEACEEQGIDCETNHLPWEEAIRASIGLNSCGMPALRLAVPAP